MEIIFLSMLVYCKSKNVTLPDTYPSVANEVTLHQGPLFVEQKSRPSCHVRIHLSIFRC